MRLLVLVAEEEQEEEESVEDSAREVTSSLRFVGVVAGVAGSEDGVLAEAVAEIGEVAEVGVVAETRGIFTEAKVVATGSGWETESRGTCTEAESGEVEEVGVVAGADGVFTDAEEGEVAEAK